MELKENLVLREGEQLVCFGTGLMGKNFARICKKNNIVISYFCDNDSNKWGTQFYGVPVISFDEVLEKEGKFVYVISNLRFLDEILMQVEKAGIPEVYYSDLEYALMIPNKSRHFPRHSMQVAKRHSDIQLANPDGVYLTDTLMTIIENCNLNCRYCSAKVPYKTTYSKTSLEEFKKNVEGYSFFFDSIRRFVLIGGEPLLHPDFYEMVQFASEQKNIQSVTITTNSTILLKEEKLKKLNPDKVLFDLSNYGDISVNLQNNSEILDKMGIPYFVHQYDHWLDLYVDVKFQENTTDVEKRYLDCFESAHVLTSMSYGHFQRCGMCTNAHESGAVPDEAIDWVDLDQSKRSIEEIRTELKQYLQKGTMEICKYCPGKDPSRLKEVPIAEQVVGKLVWPER